MVKIIEILKKQSPTKLLIGGSLIILCGIGLSIFCPLFYVLVPIGMLIAFYSFSKV